MKLTKTNLCLILYLFVLIADFSVLLNIQQFFLRQILASIMLIFVPGILINLLIKNNTISKYEYLLYTIGGSTTFIMLIGLLTNWGLPLFHIPNPLSFTYIFLSFTISLHPLFLLAILRNRNESLYLKIPKIFKKEAFLYIIPLLFPIISFLGATTLNNGGSNHLTIIMLGSVALFTIFITVLRINLKDTIYPFTLFMIGLAVLLMLSLRSWYISGFDVSIEYEVFKITQKEMHWAMSNFNNAYNTCLSITVLPTYLSAFLNVSDEYIYKFLFQVIFALTPAGIFYLVKKLGQNNIIAFLSGLFYISNPWFIDPMTTLNRQEMAFFFFILILLLLFEKIMNRVKKYTLLSIMTIGLVVSHYSTTYITIIIFSLSYLIGIFINTGKHMGLKFIKNSININIKILYLVFLIGITFIWYSSINSYTKNLTDVAMSTYKNLPHILNQNTRTLIINQIFNSKKTTISYKTYQDYYKIKSGEYSNKKLFDIYNPSLYSNYAITPKASTELPISNTNLYSIVNYIYKYLLILIELSLIIGTIYLLFFRKENIDNNFILIFLTSELLILLIIVLPYISAGYNFDRLYMHVMFILSLVVISGGIAITGIISKKKLINLKIISLFYVVVFLYTYGFIWQFVGGKTVMWLNNFGYYYDQTYTHKSEVLSATWIKQIPNNIRIYTTSSGRNMLSAYAYKNNVKTDIFPSTIETYAYVFVTNINIKEKTSSFFYRGEHLEYVYPFDFLNQNKNLIYNNGGSKVYK